MSSNNHRHYMPSPLRMLLAWVVYILNDMRSFVVSSSITVSCPRAAGQDISETGIGTNKSGILSLNFEA